MISKNTKSIPILVRPPLIALNCQKMAESNRKCLRLREWFVQEEIARAIDTALETIIGLSKRKQFKYHRGEGLFALDFHTASLTSVWKPPFLYTWRLKGLKIASLSSETLVLRILLFIKPAKLSNHFFKITWKSESLLKISDSCANYSIFFGSEMKKKAGLRWIPVSEHVLETIKYPCLQRHAKTQNSSTSLPSILSLNFGKG